MSFQPFKNTLARVREVRIPDELSGDKRADFIKRIRAAVGKQAALAESSNAVLRLVGEVREANGVLLIEHEPAAPVDLKGLLNADERPSIDVLWWFTDAVLRALADAEPKRLVHGGLQPRSLLLDRVGRVKLTDFGVASAFEAACGREKRSRVACDPATEELLRQRGLSASWARLDENSERADSWIAPFFSPEVLSGSVLLNPNSDQFSLGVLLYMLAAGVHPLGAELFNPELFGYFVPEPYPLKDERDEWAAAFERQEAATTLGEDRPILDWADLVYRLLGNEPGERFPNFTAARDHTAAHVPAAWGEALQVLGDSVDLLTQEQYEPFLTSIGPWSENEALPDVWRLRLADCIAEAEKAKAGRAARAAVEIRLKDGREALESGLLEQARAVVGELMESLGEDDPLRAGVVELDHACGEYERHIEEKSEELFQANFALAQEAMDRAEFTEARMMLAGLLDDPLTSESQSQKIETMLAEVEAAAKLYAGFRENLDAAKDEHENGALSAALERLETLLTEPELPEPLRAEAENFARKLDSERRRHEEHLHIIKDVEQALQSADLATAEETLAMLPFDTQDPFIIERRGELAAACEQLRGVIERKNEIEARLHRGEAEAALQAATAMLDDALPDVLREEIEGLAERSREIIEHVQEARLGDALESLTHAETAFQTGDVQRCRQLLSLVLSMSSQLEQIDQQRLAKLDAAVVSCEQGMRRIEDAERRLVQQEFDAADAELAAIDKQTLPDACLRQIATLRARIDQGREQHRQQRVQKLTEWLEQVAEHLTHNDIDAAEKLLDKETSPEDLDAGLLRRYEQLREDALRGRRVLEALTSVENALKDRRSEEATELLTRLEQSDDAGADWALERIEQARARIQEVEQARRAGAERDIKETLNLAAAALAKADVEEVDRLLDQARNNPHITPPLLTRCEELTGAAEALRAWLPKLAECEEALRQNQLEQARRNSKALLKQPGVPTSIEQRLLAVESAAEEKITLRRGTLLKQLAELEAELKQRGRRARAFLSRVSAVQQDPLAVAEHKNKATKLIEQFEALPKPSNRAVPIALGAVAVVVAVGAGWYFTRGGDSSTNVPNPTRHASPSNVPTVATPETPDGAPRETIPLTPAKLIDAALARIDQAYAQAVAALPEGRPAPGWEFYFQPADAFVAALYARDGADRVVTLATDVDEARIAELQWNSAWEQRLFTSSNIVEGAPPTPDAPAVEVVPAEPEWPAVLAAGVVERPRLARLRELLQTLAPAEALVTVRPSPSLMTDLLERVEIAERSESDTVGVQFVLRGDAGAVSGEFALLASGNAWRPAPENADAVNTMFEQVASTLLARQTALAEQIESQYLSGELIAAYETSARAQEVPGASRLDQLTEPTERITRIQRRLPPLWNPPEGYTLSSETAPSLGYPVSLNRAGRTLLLVNVPAGDPLWDELSAAAASAPLTRDSAGYELLQESLADPLERPWRIFYIDAGDPEQTVDADPLIFAQKSLGGELPSVTHWLMAALKLRSTPSSSGFFDGKWEWCAKDSQLWVCGGCNPLHARFLPPPKDVQRFNEIWDWLNHPLVSQPRLRGDSLAGVRAVFLP